MDGPDDADALDGDGEGPGPASRVSGSIAQPHAGGMPAAERARADAPPPQLPHAPPQQRPREVRALAPRRRRRNGHLWLAQCGVGPGLRAADASGPRGRGPRSSKSSRRLLLPLRRGRPASCDAPERRRRARRRLGARVAVSEHMRREAPNKFLPKCLLKLVFCASLNVERRVESPGSCSRPMWRRLSPRGAREKNSVAAAHARAICGVKWPNCLCCVRARAQAQES